MNYDAILAIYNCFKDKITYQPPKTVYTKNEVPEDVKEFYEEWKKTKVETNISEINEGSNSNLSIYYITPRETDSRVVTNSPDKDKIIEKLLNESRDKMVKQNIYNYLATILNNIEILPFNTEKLNKSSIYECSATGKNSEKIKIDYDEETLQTNIVIKGNDKNLRASMLSNIISTHYDGVITNTINYKKKHHIFSLFKRKSPFELNNQNKAEFISITKDEAIPQIDAYGTVYTKGGVYIFNASDNTFNLKFYDKETIDMVIKTKFDTELDLNKYKTILERRGDLANTKFIEKLEKYGVLSNIKFSIKCTPKELQSLTNKAFVNPENLIKELIQNKKIDK